LPETGIPVNNPPGIVDAVVPELLVTFDASGVHAHQDCHTVTSSPGDLRSWDCGVELQCHTILKKCCVPDRAVNRGEPRSLTDKLIQPPNWERAGSGGGPDDLLATGRH
jgi:hypothetical protein